MNRVALVVLTVALATTYAASAYGGRADDVFPISFWGHLELWDPVHTEKAVIRRQHGENATCRKQFGRTYDRFRKDLSFDGSLGYQVLVAPKNTEMMWQWGHSHVGPEPFYFWKHPDTLWVFPGTFSQIVANLTQEIVNNLADHSALMGWALWDEPDGHHYHAVVDPHSPDTIDDFYHSLFYYDDLMGCPLDSASVFSFFVQELHEQDSISGGLVFDNLTGEYPAVAGAYWWRSVSELKSPDGNLNSIDCMSTMGYDIKYDHSVGDTAGFRPEARKFDRLASADTIYTDGRIHPWFFLQGCGFSAWPGDQGSRWYRMLTAEELRLMTNLALPDQAKGLLYWRAYGWLHYDPPAYPDTSYYAGFFDEQGVPFDAPYEEYVYTREHAYYWDPDTLNPFKNGFDPFADTLDTKPPVGTEEYYLWKYEPYARRFNALKGITASVHRIKHWLGGLWKARSQLVAIEPSGTHPEPLTDVPSIAAMTESIAGDSVMGSTWAYYVNRDFHPCYSPLTCNVSLGVWWPENAGGSPDTMVLDYSGRRLRSWTVDSTSGGGPWQTTWLGFETKLETGAGELARAVITYDLWPRDFMITQPDIFFVRPDTTEPPDTVRSWLGPFPDSLLDFTVRDTVRLMADVYNLGFTGADSVTVIFYDGDPRLEINEIGSDNVSLSALSYPDTLPEVDRAFVDWVLPDTSYGGHDIHVVVNHQYEYTDNQVIRRYFHISEADSNNNHAHLPLYVYPLEYSTDELGNPWDMDEEAGYTYGTPDVDTVVKGIFYPDSNPISGVCELRINPIDPVIDDTMWVL